MTDKPSPISLVAGERLEREDGSALTVIDRFTIGHTTHADNGKPVANTLGTATDSKGRTYVFRLSYVEVGGQWAEPAGRPSSAQEQASEAPSLKTARTAEAIAALFPNGIIPHQG